MKIINLIENTKGHEGCAYAHGLSFYLETTKHKLLLDLGPSEETLHNADKLGVNLKEVDTVILSHGHYDHSGDYIIDDELELFTIKQRSHALPFTNNRLLIKESGGFARDNFLHEQYLVVRDGETAYGIMKPIMGEQLQYVHCGEEVNWIND